MKDKGNEMNTRDAGRIAYAVLRGEPTCVTVTGKEEGENPLTGATVTVRGRKLHSTYLGCMRGYINQIRRRLSRGALTKSEFEAKVNYLLNRGLMEGISPWELAGVGATQKRTRGEK